MTILHISDTHSQHRSLKRLPAADVIVHSGDICNAGTASELSDFIEWYCALDYPCKLFVAGNHDLVLYDFEAEQLQALLPENMVYLCNLGVEIEGVKFWGVSYDFGNGSLAIIPPDIDVLITHEPPLGILDFSDRIHFGSPKLLQTVLKIKPKYHLFGHIHPDYDIKKSRHTTFINAALHDRGKLLNKPVLFNFNTKTKRYEDRT
jgi:Icc-related predicted phosphoesterase